MKKINFQNLPSTDTPINATNLNAIQSNVEEVFDGEEPMGNIVVDSIRSKNMIASWYYGGLSTTDGSESGTSDARRTDFIEVDFSTISSYYLSGMPESSTGVRHFVCAYNSSKQFLGRTGGALGTAEGLVSTKFTNGTPQGTGDIKYLRVTLYSGATDSNVTNIQLEMGDSETDFTQGKNYGYVSGSNANGNYIKYDDGTLMQWGTTTITTGTSSSSIGGMTIYNGNVVQDLPLPVITGTTMSVSAQIEGGAGVLNFIYTITGTSNITLTLQSTSSNYQRTIKWLAIGRWK